MEATCVLLKSDTRNRALVVLPAQQPPGRLSAGTLLILIPSTPAPRWVMGTPLPSSTIHAVPRIVWLHEIQLKGEMNFAVAARGWEMPMHTGAARSQLWPLFKHSLTEKLLLWMQGSYKPTVQ